MMSEKTATTEELEPRAQKLDGSLVADQIKHEVAADVERLRRESGVRPCLAAIQVGDDPASSVYVENKVRTSESLGLRSIHHQLSAEATEKELLELVGSLNENDDVDGILVQLPLPDGIDKARVLEAVLPAKDVDGFHPLNVGRLSLGQQVIAPCTPAGIIELLERSGIPISGARACIVGRSHIVGRPLFQLLLQRDATVTICHSRTRDLEIVTREADILIAAVGRAAFIRGKHIKPGATVVDVGINKIIDQAAACDFFGEDAETRLASIARRGFTLVGDVHPAEARRVAGKLTPVPGGVGPLTVAMLMRNTVTAARRRRGIQEM